MGYRLLLESSYAEALGHPTNFFLNSSPEAGLNISHQRIISIGTLGAIYEKLIIASLPLEAGINSSNFNTLSNITTSKARGRRRPAKILNMMLSAPTVIKTQGTKPGVESNG